MDKEMYSTSNKKEPPVVEKESIHYTTPDYERLPPKEKIKRIEGLRDTAKQLARIGTMDRNLKERYSNKVAFYDKLIDETKKLLQD